MPGLLRAEIPFSAAQFGNDGGMTEVGGGLEGAGRGGGGGFLGMTVTLACSVCVNVHHADWPETSARPFKVEPGGIGLFSLPLAAGIAEPLLADVS